MEETEFKVFTLNCWGLPLFSKDKSTRMLAIATFLSASKYDFVCLQEVWATSDFNIVRDRIVGTFPYSHYFHSGVIGSGVCIFSKHPIRDAFFHQWTVNGYVHKLQHGDWFGGKGVGMCRIQVNDYVVNLYTAHLLAEYDRENDEYQAHRILQAFDIAQFIKLTSGGADLVILGGDLNIEPGDLAYRILITTTGLYDAHEERNGGEKLYTNETPTNSYTPPALIDSNFPGKRIDYVLYSASPNANVALKNYQHPLPTRIPDHDFSYSDHEGIAVVLRLALKNIQQRRVDVNAKINALEECIDVCNSALTDLAYQKRLYWFASALLFFVLVTLASTSAPFNAKIVYIILKVTTSCVMIYTFIMATLWNMIEGNEIEAQKLTMEINLKQCVAESP